MGIVNRYAKGLLSVLDSQTQGDTPSSMGDVIAPIFDVQEYLLASKGSSVDQRQNVFIALGQVVESPVPAGEQWWIRSVHMEIVARDNVACSWRFAIFLVTPGVQYPIAQLEQLAQLNTIGQGLFFQRFFDKPLVMRTGDALATTCALTTGVPVLGANVTLTWVYDKLTA